MPEEKPTHQEHFEISKFLIIALAVVCLAALGMLAWYWIKGEPATTETSTTSTTEQATTETATDNTTKTTDETADWKTYTNDTYGFSFQYPKDWSIKENAGSNYQLSVVSITSPETAKNNNDKLIPYNENMSVYYYPSVNDADGSNPKTAKTVLDLLNNKYQFSSYSETTFAGTKAYDAIEVGMSSYYSIVLEKNSHIFKIFFSNIDNKTKLTTDEKTILSTFQFTK